MALRATQPGKVQDRNSHVVQVAVGEQHALMLTADGIVWSWGLNPESGTKCPSQIGRPQKSGDNSAKLDYSKPEPILSFFQARLKDDAIERKRDNQVIVQIACGLNHSLALSQQGILYSWGHNTAGQLGRDCDFAHQADSTTGNSDKEVKPTDVCPFNCKDPSKIVKTCSCGPESSACVTTIGEVYVWGAISYFLFGHGCRYTPSENFTVPVKVRGIPHGVIPNNDYIPDQIALATNRFACTISHKKLEEDLLNLISSYKHRSTKLLKLSRTLRRDKKEEATHEDDPEKYEVPELVSLDEAFKTEKSDCEKRIREIESQLTSCRSELQRVSREITVCDQQDTALTERASQLEVNRNEEKSTNSSSRQLETQLNDINHFKSANRSSKMKLLVQRDKLDQQCLDLTQELTLTNQKKRRTEARAKVIRSLRRNDLGTDDTSSIDDGLRLAMSKREELGATDPQMLAGKGKFLGFREVLSVSERALQDVSSALKEVSATLNTSDGSVLEEVLEHNLRLRKSINSQLLDKLVRAERGSPAIRSQAEAEGAAQFFKEASSAIGASKDYQQSS